MQIPNDRFSKLRALVNTVPEHGVRIEDLLEGLREVLDIADKLYIIIEEIEKERSGESASNE